MSEPEAPQPEQQPTPAQDGTATFEPTCVIDAESPISQPTLESFQSVDMQRDMIPQPHGGSLVRLRPGQSGNPKGRKAAGAFVKDHFNSLAWKMQRGKLTFTELRKIAKTDPNANRRIAAIQMIQACDIPDMADFESAANGSETLVELRKKGVDTAHVKKIKVRKTKAGIEREIELHDRSGAAFDRIMDRTVGRPAGSDGSSASGNTFVFNLPTGGSGAVQNPSDYAKRVANDAPNLIDQPAE